MSKMGGHGYHWPLGCWNGSNIMNTLWTLELEVENGMTIYVRCFFFVQNFWVHERDSFTGYAFYHLAKFWSLPFELCFWLWLFCFGVCFVCFCLAFDFLSISALPESIFIALLSLKELNWPTTLWLVRHRLKKRWASQTMKHLDFPVRHAASVWRLRTVASLRWRLGRGRRS